MEFRYLGNSGLKISEITFGNWLTHGSQVENDVATAMRRVPRSTPASPRSTRPTPTRTRRRRQVLGDALKGERRAEPGDLHEGLLAHRAARGQRRRAVAQAHHGVDRRFARRVSAPTTSTCTRPTATTARRRSRRRCRRSPTSCGQGKALYIGVSEWNAEQLRAGHALSKELRLPAHLEPAAVLDAVAGHRGGGRARPRANSASRRSSGRRWRRACSPASTCRAQSSPPGSRATDEKGGADMIKRFLDDEVLTARPAAEAHRRRARPHHGAAGDRVGAAERQHRRARSSGPRVPSRSPRTSRRPA